MKGIILAGGQGTRMHPITLGVSKQMLPVYDKPLIYYPLSTLMLAGITEILIISSPEYLDGFKNQFGDGSELGLSITYAEQEKPRGIAEALLIGADHVGSDSVALVLGDNIFHGPGFGTLLQETAQDVSGCVVFGYPVRDPERYGVGEIDSEGNLMSLVEKPNNPHSNLAITGLYFYDKGVVDIVADLRPSERGELEITDVNRAYIDRGAAKLVELGRGFFWLDAGTHDALAEATQYVQLLENRQGVRVACIEEIAWRMGYIDREACVRLGERLAKSRYGQYLIELSKTHSSRQRSPMQDRPVAH